MVTEEHIKGLMMEALPRCPFCGSDSDYDVVSVVKGVVQCRSCGAEWSSIDFMASAKLKNLKIRELPRGVHTFTHGRYSLRRYEEYPVIFWRSLGKRKQPLFSIERWEEIRAVILKGLLIFLIAFIPRILLIDETSIMTDEPLYVSTGRLYVKSFLKLDFSTEVWSKNAEHPPIAKLWMGLFTYLFMPLLGGENIHNLYYSARIASVTAGTLLSVAIYILGRKYYGETASLLGALLTATSPWLIYYSTLGILDIFAAFFFTLTYLFLPYAKISNKYFILVGIFLGLAIGSKGTAVPAIPGIGIYLLLLKVLSRLGQEEKESYPLRKILAQIFLTPLIAMVVFFATWPWLWRDTLARIFWVLNFHASHMTSGHTTFYAGVVYSHVPQWVTGYILFVKTPLLSFILCIFFLFFVAAKILRREKVGRGPLSVFSWLVGGVLSMLAFRIIIGDHYVLFLGPAVLLSASIFITELFERLKKSNANIKKVSILIYAMALLIVAESSAGLLIHWLSPCGYANEIVIRADRAVLIIDTGFEDVADYIIKYCETNAKIAVAYSTSLMTAELHRKGKTTFQILGTDELKTARYAVFPSIYTQRYGFPSEIKNWTLIYTAKSGETILSYVFKAPT